MINALMVLGTLGVWAWHAYEKNAQSSRRIDAMFRQMREERIIWLEAMVQRLGEQQKRLELPADHWLPSLRFDLEKMLKEQRAAAADDARKAGDD